MSAPVPLRTVPVRNLLGECILWDDLTHTVCWTDIHSRRFYRYDPETFALRDHALPERLCAFGFVENDTRLIGAFETGFAFYDPQTGAVDWLWRPEIDYRGTRFNDGRVDRQGRFWSGTMVEGEAFDCDGQPARGSLYWIRGDQRARALTEIGISNSLCWSLDSSRLYFTDSPTREIIEFEFDAKTARLGASSVFARIDSPAAPDGSTIDSDGYLWNAEWGGSRVVRHAPSGAVDLAIELPVSQPTCVCFGGPALDLLFVSSAREGLSDEQLSSEPEAGNVLVYRTPYRGVPECRYGSEAGDE